MTTNFPTPQPNRLPADKVSKVTPEIMSVMLLDEMVGRLAELQEMFNGVYAESELQSFITNITDQPTKISVDCSYLSIHNNGADPVYVLGFKGNPTNEAPINSGGQLNIDLKTKRQRQFYVVCAEGGTASIGVFTR